jgi:hypothetical protein
MYRIWRMCYVTAAKLKRRDEETPGYNPGTLDKCSARISQLDKLYKSTVLYGRLTVLLFLHKFHDGEGGSQGWPSFADRSLDARFCPAQKHYHPVRCLLLNDQLDAQFFSMYLFQFCTCFEQPRAHHQENQLYQYNIWYISLCVGDRFVCRSEWNYFPTCRRYN